MLFAEAAGGACMLLACVLLYLLPSAVAIGRGHPNTGPIMIVDLFLGWTLIGWVVSLAWACSAITPPR